MTFPFKLKTVGFRISAKPGDVAAPNDGTMSKSSSCKTNENITGKENDNFDMKYNLQLKDS